MTANDPGMSDSDRETLVRLQRLLAHTSELGRRTRGGETIPLDPLLAEIEELMPAISAMRGGAGSAVQAPLHALLEEVNAIVAHLEGECALVRDEVHSVSNRRRASIAYASRNGLGSGESD
ncbi:MAG: hypothetical protein R3C70_08195 [Geminicoccaceae bacterium]